MTGTSTSVGVPEDCGCVGDVFIGDVREVLEVRVGRRCFGFILASWRAFRTTGSSCVAGNHCPLTGFLGVMGSAYLPVGLSTLVVYYRPRFVS